MRNRAQEYRDNAFKCFSVAEAINAQAIKAQLLAMAHAWHNLADQAERNSQTDLVYETPEPQQPVAQQQQQIKPDEEPEKE